MFHGSGWWTFLSHDDTKGRPKVSRDLLLRVFQYARPYWFAVVVVLTTIVIVSLIELIPPLLYAYLIDEVLPNKNFQQLNLLALGMIGIPVLSGLIGVLQRYYSAKAGEGIIYDLRQEMFDHLQRMSIRFFKNTKSGEIISRFNNDVVGAQGAITGTIPNIVTNVVTLVSTLIVMLQIEWRLTLISVVVLPLFLLPSRRVAVIFREIRREAMRHNAEMSNIISETLSISGALLVKIFGRQPEETRRFSQSNESVREIGVRRALVGRWFFLGLSIAAAIGTALIYWVGGYMVIDEVITIGTIVAFAAYLTRLYGPISSLSNIQVEFASSIVSFERVFEYLDLPIEIQDRPDAVPLPDISGSVRFEGVSFTYLQALADGTAIPAELADMPVSSPRVGANGDEEAETEITRSRALSDVSFEILPGQLAALVGRSGAGKSTVTYLLPRLYDPTEGRITIDGYDLRGVTLESLARQIGVVSQETYLFHDTIRANLEFARPEATQEEIESACRAANIHDFIVTLPDGYETLVGERGYRLSGGEKQRLAIARAILKDPRILILDEATSHLDSHNEALIQQALMPLFQDRTSLVIAHRLSTILAADKIFVLEEGRLVEEGTHRQLIQLGGLYAHLYETQFSVSEANVDPA